MRYTHEQTFWSQQSRDDLTPRFSLRRNQQLVALRFQLRGGLLNILYVEFNPRLWHRKIVRPLIAAKAGLSRLRHRPQGKMLHAIQRARIQIAMGILFELQRQRLGIELPLASGSRTIGPKPATNNTSMFFGVFTADLLSLS